MRKCLAKKHDEREEKCHFGQDFLPILSFELGFELRSPKLPTSEYFSLIHRKTKKQQRPSTF